MKRIIFFLVALISCASAFGQFTPQWTPVINNDQRVRSIWPQKLLMLPSDTVTVKLEGSFAYLNGSLYYKTATKWESLVSGYLQTFMGRNNVNAVLTHDDIVSVLGYNPDTLATRYKVQLDSIYLKSQIDLKLNISDTSAMLNPGYVRSLRFIDSLFNLRAGINTKLAITDAASIYTTISRTIDSLAALQARIQTKEPLITAGTTGQYWRGDKSWQTLDKAAVGLSNVPNTDATNASNIGSGTLPDARLSGNVTLQGNSFNAANQLVKLDGSGKLPTSTIPSLALVETFVVNSQAAMLALSAQMGDVAVRTDNDKSYILQAEPASTLSNWVQLLTPSSEADPVYTASTWYSTTNNSGNWNTAYSWGNHASAGYAMASRTITINGTTYDLTANRSWSVGTVTSVGLTLPTGLTVSGSPITTSGTLAVSLQSGYSIPTTSSQTNWDAAYNDKINSITFSASTLTLTQQDGGTVTQSVPQFNQNTTGYSRSLNDGTSTFSVDWQGSASSINNMIVFDGSNNIKYAPASTVQSFLGLGSNAYTSTAYLPLTGGTLTGALSGTTFDFTRITSNATEVRLKGDIVGNVDNAYDVGSSSLRIRDGWFSRNMYINGNVGIGTTSPNVKLETVGAGALIGGTAYNVSRVLQDKTDYRGVGFGYDASGQIGIIFPETPSAASILAFWNYNGSAWGEMARFTGGRRFLVNTTTDDGSSIGQFNGQLLAQNLKLDAASANGSGRAELFSSGTRFGAYGTGNWALGDGTTDFSFLAETGRGFKFAVDGSSTVRLAISSAGVVTVSNYLVSGYLQASGATGLLVLTSSSWGANSEVRNNTDINGGSGGDYMTFKNPTGKGFSWTVNGASVANLSAGGTITATGDVIAYSTSDRRLKNNIRSITNALATVERIGGYSYDWNSKQDVYSGHDYGVLAQEIEIIMPEAVITRPNGYKAVKYERLIPLLIQAIKELKYELDKR